jgi:DNA-binding transcriptional LysR family regulator
MPSPDLNLLYTLDALLSEGSVTRAGRKLRLSPSAMSRALARLRDVTGDQLLVRAGRGLVPTKRATEMRGRVRELVEEAQALLRPEAGLNLSALRRTFTIRASDGLAEAMGRSLINKVQSEAPGVRLHFVRKLDKDSGGLRDGSLDFETGVVGETIGPEVKAQALFVDRYVGVVRVNHPLATSEGTAADYAAWPHVVTWRQGLDLGGIDQALLEIGLKRDIIATVDGFSSALALARVSELVATVAEKHTATLRDGMHSFALPVATPEFTISLLWHPRLDGDPAHRWLRACIQEACQGLRSPQG